VCTVACFDENGVEILGPLRAAILLSEIGLKLIVTGAKKVRTTDIF